MAPKLPAEKKARAAKSRDKGKKAAPAPTDVEEPAPPLPRVLIEKATVTYDSDQEMRHEFDLMVAWLQRKDLSRDDRRILQIQVAALAPQLGASLQQEAGQKRQERIAQALTPGVTKDARGAILEATRVVDGIRPLNDGSGNYFLMHGQEMITLSADEATNIRERAMAEMDKAMMRISRISQDAWDNINYQAKVDREHIGAAWVVSWFTDHTTWTVLDQTQPIVQAANQAVTRYQAARKRGDLITMGNEMATAEENAVNAFLKVQAHVDDIQTTGGKVVAGLAITSAVAFTIVMVASAGTAAPAVGAFWTGAGATGVVGTGLTVATTATGIGLEGAALYGGSSALGTGIAGGTW
jgi:hypothetical protein